MDKIFISGLKLETIIGVYPEERLAPQPIILDIELTADTKKAAANDNIADAIDYDTLVKNLQIWVTKKHVQLIETLANDLAEKILQTFSAVEKVCLRLHKFPTGLPITSVSVVVIRTRN